MLFTGNDILTVPAGRILPDRDIRKVHHDAQTSGQTSQAYREGESRCDDTGAFKKEKEKEYRTVLDVIPGNAGISLVAGADGTGDLLPAKRKEGEDSFSRAEILCQVEAHTKKETG